MPVTIQRLGAPVRRSPRTLLLMSVLVGLPATGLVVWVFPESFAWRFVAAWVLMAVATAVIVSVVMLLMFPGVVVDVERGTVRIRSTEVPLTSIARVTRSISDNGAAQALLYRLVSDAGPSARLLVVSRPFRGLSLDEVRALRVLVERSGLPSTESGGSAQAELLRGDTHANLAAAAVGREALLIELGHIIEALEDVSTGAVVAEREGVEPHAAATPASASAAAPAEPGSRSVVAAAVLDADTGAPETDDGRRLLALVSALDADDEDARRVIADAPDAAGRVAVTAVLVLVLAVVAFAVACVWAVVGAFSGPPVGALSLMGWSLLIGFAALLVWAAAADRRVRRLSELGARWLDADPARRPRGLAAPFLELALDPSNRLLMIGAFTGSTLGGMGLLLGVAMIATEAEAGLIPFATTIAVVGAVALGLSIWGFVAARRRRMRLVARFAELAGQRGELAYGRF
ncbi:hypothetical protein [Agromyces sp. Marseille-Q5079]|uniref:hypothetical protein n=1 Tax=Agromyces sp. Marseille-Q5079 TaxID=3439059 RepID=UPI003D9C9916